MREEFVHRLEYNCWGNRRIHAALLAMPSFPPKSLAICSHIVLAELTWLHRVKLRPSALQIWEEIPRTQLAALMEESAARWKNYLNALPEGGLAEQIAYTTSRGDHCKNSVAEIVTHVINHGSYHRGQLALLIRQAGTAPPMTDYIIFLREKAGSAS